LPFLPLNFCLRIFEKLSGEIFSKEIKKQYQHKQNNDDKQIPLFPGFEYWDLVVSVAHN